MSSLIYLKFLIILLFSYTLFLVYKKSITIVYAHYSSNYI